MWQREWQWEGKGLDDPGVRTLFTRDHLMKSDWYAARLKARQAVEHRLWRDHVSYLERFLKRTSHADEARRLGIAGRLERAKKTAAEVDSPAYLEKLAGTLGAEPIDQYLGESNPK